MKKYLTKLQPVLLSLVFLCGTGAVLGWTWLGIAGYGEELYERMQTIENQNAFDTQFNELQKMVAETEEERNRMEDFIIGDESDTITLLSQFDDIAAAHNVELETGRLEVVEKEGNFNDLALQYRMTGSEFSVTKMIKMFETLPYHGQITSLSVQRLSDTETGSMKLSASISLLISTKKYD